jgi:hypothetical protein
MRLGLFLLPSLLVLGSCALPINSATSSSSKGGSDVAISNSEVITSEPFEYGENYIATHLGNEYEIAYSYSTKSNGVVAEPLLITSAHNASGYYIKDNAGTEALFLKDGTTYVVYMPNEEGQLALVPDLRLDEENVKGYSTSFLSYMSIYEIAKDDLVEDGNESIAGRTCQKYVFHASYVASAIDLHYSIDIATGVCLRYEATAVTGADTSAFQFLCTVFKTSGVVLPSHI